MPAYFAYYRVSTQQQGASGLGLEGQRAAVVSFLKGGQPQAEHIEVESGEPTCSTRACGKPRPLLPPAGHRG
jgi:DNA invertase Pin-like site-specific DNA recombinase